jgi:hypothetical protein
MLNSICFSLIPGFVQVSSDLRSACPLSVARWKGARDTPKADVKYGVEPFR